MACSAWSLLLWSFTRTRAANRVFCSAFRKSKKRTVVAHRSDNIREKKFACRLESLFSRRVLASTGKLALPWPAWYYGAWRMLANPAAMHPSAYMPHPGDSPGSMPPGMPQHPGVSPGMPGLKLVSAVG